MSLDFKQYTGLSMRPGFVTPPGRFICRTISMQNVSTGEIQTSWRVFLLNSTILHCVCHFCHCNDLTCKNCRAHALAMISLVNYFKPSSNCSTSVNSESTFQFFKSWIVCEITDALIWGVTNSFSVYLAIYCTDEISWWCTNGFWTRIRKV